MSPYRRVASLPLEVMSSFRRKIATFSQIQHGDTCGRIPYCIEAQETIYSPHTGNNTPCMYHVCWSEKVKKSRDFSAETGHILSERQTDIKIFKQALE